MHKQESVLENETHKLLEDCEKETDLVISSSRPDSQPQKKNKKQKKTKKKKQRELTE